MVGLAEAVATIPVVEVGARPVGSWAGVLDRLAWNTTVQMSARVVGIGSAYAVTAVDLSAGTAACPPSPFWTD